MFVRVLSGTVIGVDAHSVIVEARRGQGLPGMALIGLARGAVKESLVRVRSAIRACDLPMSSYRLVINLLPAELPKEASALDLPIAVALLAVTGVVTVERLAGLRFYGELSLSGLVESVNGSALIADLARRNDDKEVFVPLDNAQEAAVIPGVKVYGVSSLQALIAHLTGDKLLPLAQPMRDTDADTLTLGNSVCLSDVRGQTLAKRGFEIAAAGGHNILLMGPPGSGKTMLARRLTGLLPALSDDERIEVTRIHSAAGTHKGALLSRRPFRAPHHCASEVALCGGGSIPRPGEVTLAHRGVLFLDEFPEFSRKALEALREPLEEGEIHIARATWSLSFPARVILVAAMNPCPCGRFNGDRLSARRGNLRSVNPLDNDNRDHNKKDKQKIEMRKSGPPPCLCSMEQIQRYRARISGPLLDRIDIHIPVDAVPYRHFLERRSEGETSVIIQKRVQKAREIQWQRLGNSRSNADMSHNECHQHVHLGEEAMAMLETAIDRDGFSARAIGRVLKVARTIADLGGEQTVTPEHIAEGIGLRGLDRSPVAQVAKYG